MSSEFYCKACEVTCNGKKTFDQHLQSTKHLSKVKAFESHPSNINRSVSIPTPPSPLNTTQTSTIIDRANSDGRNLPSNPYSIGVETMRTLFEWNHPDGHRPYCDICHLLLHGNGNASLHFDSKNLVHNNRLAMWKRIQEENPSFSCRVCSDIFPNENSMREHFSSSQHLEKARDKESIQKFIKIYQTYNKLKEVRSNRKDEEINSMIDNKFSDKFQNMKIIDGSTDFIAPPRKSCLFDTNTLAETMLKVKKPDYDDDDDDDDY